MVAGDSAVPPLRDEIHCLPGPRDVNGAPTWTLYDPAANRFFRIGWREYEILARWTLLQPERIAEAVNAETPLRVDRQQIDALTQFLRQNNLLRTSGDGALRLLQRQAARRGQNGWQWLLHNYLFFKIPLLNPDALLRRLYRYAAWLYGSRFLTLAALCFLLSIFLLSRQWERFLATFSYFFTWTGLAQYFAALILAKTLHEFGHALTLHRYGCRVPAVGIAFMVMYPMLYTDASEAWKLRDRRRRLAVAFAGIAAELCLAVFASLLWSFLADGPARSAAFLLATSTWIMTLAVNLNPFMRFDGYYLLADWLGVDNLQPRSFDYARWHLRRLLFGINRPPPEQLSKPMRRLFTGYAWATWLYRFFLFLGIALLVYHFCFKLLGLVLMIVEVGWFIGRPVVLEISAWKTLRPAANRERSLKSLSVLFVLALVLILPWRGHVSAPAFIKAEQYAELLLPHAARLDVWHAQNGRKVQAGELLARLSSPELTYESGQSLREGRSLAWQLAYQGTDQGLMQRRRVLLMELASASSKQAGIKQQQDQLQIRAPFSGLLLDSNEQAQIGQWLASGEALFIIVNPGAWTIEGYIQEEELRLIEADAAGLFYPDNAGSTPIPCRLKRIDQGGAARIPPLLASAFGGDLAARPGPKQEQIPESAVYRIVLSPDIGAERQKEFTRIVRGRVRLRTPGVSLLERVWMRLMTVAVRESGF